MLIKNPIPQELSTENNLQKKARSGENSFNYSVYIHIKQNKKQNNTKVKKNW